MKFLSSVLASVVLLGSGFATANSTANSTVNPNPNAPVGGNFVINIIGEPPTLHPITSTDGYSQSVHSYVMDSLLSRDPNTYEWKPRIAEKFEISKDNKTFTFKIRKDAFFHDGKPVTAEDVKFSFDAIFDPAYNAAHLRPYFEGIAKVEITAPDTIVATAKDNYFKNFDSIAGLTILPKHVYADAEKSKALTRQLVGCGPYSLEKFDRGQKIILKRNDKWYGFKTPDWKGAYNFATIDMRFYKEENVTLERAKKGELDFIDLRIESFVKKTNEAPWGKTVFKHKVENASPKGYGFIGWNFRREMFQDRNVRVALAHLMNRTEMNKKFRFDMSDLATGPTYLRSDYASSKVKPILFDPKKASELLAKAGWKDSNKDGILEKEINGKKVDFKFTLIHASKDSEKYWTMYKEDLKKAGIEMEVRYLEWNSFLKLTDEGNFDAVALAWGGGGIEWDPKQIWHSSSAVAGGSNFINYKNPEVDKLIDEARVETNKEKRAQALKLVYEKIAADAPYAFMFNDKFAFYAVSGKVQQPGETMKYEVGSDYWWLKP